MLNHWWRRIRLLAVMLLAVVAAGCEVQLYDNLGEEAANEIMAALIENEIPVSKGAGTEGTWKVMVEESQFARAMQILKKRGLPRAEYETMGVVFKKEGLLSTPLEEKARYMYALSEELSKTISSIDGVLESRVHIVLPEINELGETVTPATVSVFIKHSELAASRINAKLDDIKKLVGKSIQGIEPNNIYITLFPSDETVAQAKQGNLYETVLGIQVMRGAGYQIWLLIAMIGVLVVLLGATIYWLKIRPGASAADTKGGASKG